MKNLYTVYDVKANIHNNPMVQNNNAEAMRTFAQLANDEKTFISKYPEDYQLCLVGEYDELTGRIVGIEQIQILCRAIDFVEIKETE